MVCYAATALPARLIHPQTAGLKLQSLKTISKESLAALLALPMRGHGRGQAMRAARAEHTGHTMLLSAVGPEYSSQLPAGRKCAISDPGSRPQKTPQRSPDKNRPFCFGRRSLPFGWCNSHWRQAG